MDRWVGEVVEFPALQRFPCVRHWSCPQSETEVGYPPSENGINLLLLWITRGKPCSQGSCKKKKDKCLDPRFLLWIFLSPQPPAQWGHILRKGSRVPLGIRFWVLIIALIKVHGQTFARLPFLPNMSWTWWIWYVSSTALPTVSIHKCQQASGLPHRADTSGLENYINSHQAFLPHHVRRGEGLVTLLSPWRKVTSRSFCHHLSFFLAPVVCNWLRSPSERWLEVSTSGGLSSSSFHLFLIPWLTGFEL